MIGSDADVHVKGLELRCWLHALCAQLKVYDGQLVERMRELLSHDLCVTINSDDPSYFGGCPSRLL
jgi:hypothetical protein